MTLRDAAEYIVAAGFVIIAASGVLTVAWPAFRRLTLERLLGSAWYAVTAKTRAEDRRQARRERLRSAIGILSEGLAMGLHEAEAQVKIAQALSEFRSEGPSSLKDHLDLIGREVASKTSTRQYRPSQEDIRELVEPVIDAIRPEIQTA